MPYKFQTIAVPDASDGTRMGGINNAGDAVGYDSGFGSDHYPHAFVYSHGTVTPITLTVGYNQTTANGINNLGEVVGASGTPPVGVYGYRWSPQSSVLIANPAATVQDQRNDEAYGINDHGQVVGADFVDQHAGFVWQNGAMSFIKVPGATTTEAHGINNAGVIVGTANEYGFIDFGGQTYLLGIAGATTVDPTAINNATTVVGSYNDGTHWHGFIDQGGNLSFINAPNASDTWISGINDSGQISGTFTPSDGGPVQGFIATDPPADPVTTMVREDYVGLFGHDADPGAQAFWTQQLKTTTMTARDFVWALTQSAESQALHGGQTSEQFVNSVYQNSLGRPAEPNAQTNWASVIQSGAGRWDVLSAIATSPEGQIHFASTHA